LLTSCGYRPHAFATGEEALDSFADGPLPGVALVDLDLPGMNGLEFISRMQAIDASVFAVLVTATDRDTLANRLRDKPYAYLRKPLDVEKLLRLLAEHRFPHN